MSQARRTRVARLAAQVTAGRSPEDTGVDLPGRRVRPSGWSLEGGRERLFWKCVLL